LIPELDERNFLKKLNKFILIDRPSGCLAAPHDNENKYPPHPNPLPPRGEGKK